MEGFDLLPDDPKELRTAKYWARFFETLGGADFEWYAKAEEVWPLLQQYCSRRAGLASERGDGAPRVLHSGTGNSSLPMELYDLGLRDALAVDYVPAVIEEMKEKCGDGRDGLAWAVMDATKLTALGDAEFDAIIDKGLIDALMTDASEESAATLDLVLGEAERVLRPSGRYCLVTLGQQHIVALLLRELRQRGWGVDLHELLPQSPDSSLLPFLFVLCKGENGSKPGRPLLRHHLDRGERSMSMWCYGATDKCEAWLNDAMEMARGRFMADVFSRALVDSPAAAGGGSRSFVVLDIKPYEAEADLDALADRILGLDVPGVQWFEQIPAHISLADDESRRIIPIGYGVSKLRLSCIIEDDMLEVEELGEAIEDTDDEEVVQSVDIAEVVPCGVL